MFPMAWLGLNGTLFELTWLPMTASDPHCNICETTSMYHMHFLLQHQRDKALGHPQSRWWPQWNRFSISPLNQIMEFDLVQLFSPCLHPTPPSKHFGRSTAVSLSAPTCNLLGPFNFQPHLLTSDPRSIVTANDWDCLFSTCQSPGNVPPALSPATRSP
jgi:hypothetical protein